MRIFPILGWMLFPGCWAVTGPGAVCGTLGGSVTVRCRYQESYERSPKFWCRGGRWSCSNGHIAETDGSEAEVKRGRVSIRDNHPQHTFTVTVENLTPADAGTYHCGVGRDWARDPRDTVELIISPAKSTPRPTERSSSATAAATAHSSPSSTERSSSATEPPASSSPAKSTSIRTTTEDGKPSVSTNQGTTAPGRAQDSDIPLYILLPCVLLVLMLFLIAAVMLVRLSKKRKKALSGASVQRDKKIHLSNLAVGNKTAGGSPEQAVIDSPAATDQTGFYSNVEALPNSVNPDSNYVEIQPHGQGSEEVSYVTVTISTPDQQPIYANMEQRPKTRRPDNPAEETLYSAVK